MLYSKADHILAIVKEIKRLEGHIKYHANLVKENRVFIETGYRPDQHHYYHKDIQEFTGYIEQYQSSLCIRGLQLCTFLAPEHLSIHAEPLGVDETYSTFGKDDPILLEYDRYTRGAR